MAKADVETKVYTEYNEQFQAVAWIILILLLAEMLILERKNPLFRNIHLFSTKKRSNEYELSEIYRFVFLLIAATTVHAQKQSVISYEG